MEVDKGSDQKSDIQPHWMAGHARLKNEFTEDEKCHNLMRWLKYSDRKNPLEARRSFGSKEITRVRNIPDSVLLMSWAMRKRILCHIRTTKAVISLRIRAV